MNRGITPNGKGIVFNLPNPEAVAAKLPIPSVVRHGKLALPYTHDTIKILTNMGVPMQGWHPFERIYTAPKVKMQYTMYPHALTTAKRMVEMERGFVLNDPRLGKTSSVVAATHFLQYHGHPGGTLIVAPLTTLESVWVNEIRGMVPGAKIGVLHHKTKVGAARVKHCRNVLKAQRDYYIVNPDGIKNPQIQSFIHQAIKEGRINKMVIDESTQYGNVETKNWEAARALSATLRWFWMMTGTPGAPLMVYGQAKLMRPESVPSSEYMWKMRTMYKSGPFKWLVRSDADKHIEEVLQPCVRFNKREVWKDMPKELIEMEKVDLDPKAVMLLKILDEDGAAFVGGAELTPANAAVLASKVMQISTGTVKVDGDEVKRIPMKDKFERLKYLCTQTEGKTIVFANFKASIQYLKELFDGTNLKSDVVYGDVSMTKRTEIFRKFQDTNQLDVIICHPKTVSYGVELAAADTVVWFGPPMISPMLYQQAKERLFSTLQESTQPIIYQMASLEAEVKMFNSLDTGVSWQNGISQMFEDHVITKQA